MSFRRKQNGELLNIAGRADVPKAITTFGDPIEGKPSLISQLYDKLKSTKIFPITKDEAVLDDDGVSVKTKIDKLNAVNIYSTDEIDTGKIWIDGKHIFRKCYDVVVPNNNATLIDNTMTFDYVDALIESYGCIKRTNNYINTIPMSYPNVNIYTQILINDNGLYVDILNLSYTQRAIFVVEYTKK